MRRSFVALFLVTALAGCPATRMHGDTLRSRASFDLRCPAGQLQITEIDGQTGGVEGCGVRATYIWNKAADTWVLNSPTDGPATAPAAEPPPPAAEPPPPPPAAPPAPQ